MNEANTNRNRWYRVRGIVAKILKTVIALALIGGVVYWMKFSPIPVSSYKIERGPIVAEVMGTGTLEARVQTSVSTKIAGRIESVAVDQGDRVSKGDLLLQLDDLELQQQVAIAQANVEAATAAIERLTADKSRAEAAFTQAQKSFDRVESLSQRGAASQDDSDKATEALAVAVTGVARAEAAITEGQKELIAAEQTLEYHRTRLNDCQVMAPFDGLILSRNREPGDVVAPGSPVLKLISTEQIWIHAWVDETEMSKVHPDQPARVLFRSQPNRDFEGKVFRLAKEADRETREFIVDVDVLQLPENWAVGQRAEAYIEVARSSDAILLPADQVLNRDGKLGVFVNADGKAFWQPIQIGLRNRDWVEVVDGLETNDLVIKPIRPETLLSDGRQVVLR